MSYRLVPCTRHYVLLCSRYSRYAVFLNCFLNSLLCLCGFPLSGLSVSLWVICPTAVSITHSPQPTAHSPLEREQEREAGKWSHASDVERARVTCNGIRRVPSSMHRDLRWRAAGWTIFRARPTASQWGCCPAGNAVAAAAAAAAARSRSEAQVPS